LSGGLKLSMTDFAKRRDVKLKDIKQAIKDGIIPEEAVTLGSNNRKIINVEIAERAWNKHYGYEPAFKEEEKVGSGYRKGSMMVDEESMPLYSKARASKTAYEAKIAQVKYEELTGSLVKVEEVKTVAKDIGRNLRDALMNIPNKLSPVLAAETNVDEVSKVLEAEIRAALENLSRGNYSFNTSTEE